MNRVRLGLGLAGLTLAILAVAFDSPIGGWAAIGLLAGSLIIRLIQRRRSGG